MDEYVQWKPLNVKPVSKGLYLTLIILGVSLGWILLIPMIYFLIFDVEVSLTLSFLAIIIFLIGQITFLVLLYKGWEAIQDYQTRTTPGKAIGFLFIPLFNIYWMFVAYYGFAVEYNKFIRRNNINVPYLPEGLFLSHPILTLIFPIPLVIIDPIIANHICNGINNLAYYQPLRETIQEPKPEPRLKYEPTTQYPITKETFAVLISESGPLRGQTFKLNPKNSYIIGRAGDITIPSEDKTTSREHAKIRDENGNFVIYDMGSTNHTYVNGERVDRKILLDGDRIKIGQNIFRFQIVRGK